jgi:FixJ family two-component response regulator
MPGSIAIIDDDESVRDTTRMLLRSLGYVTATFASAEDFLNLGEIARTSCVITDIRMPGMSGVTLQTRLIEQGRRIPVIFVTAFPEEKIKQQVLSAGAHGFLVKPYQEHSLISCIEGALNAQAARE